MRRYIPLLMVISLVLLTACRPNRSGDVLAAPGQTQSPVLAKVTVQPSDSTKATASELATETLVACPVTQPPDPPFVPPEPYEEPLQGEFWYGSPVLWTSLPPDGIWRDLPHNETGYVQKLAWWRQGYNWKAEPEPDLTVTGRRLDGEAPPLVSSKATNAYAEDIGSVMMVGVDIPTDGCWEITASIDGQELTFIIQVISSDR